MDVLLKCPLCDSVDFINYLQCKDFTVSRETFQIQKCATCSFLFTNPRPAENEIGKYYESDEYISHSNATKGLFNKAYQLIRKYSIRKKIALIESLKSSSKSLLDIGCGTGEFLNAAKNANWKVLGLEPSPGARSYGIRQYDLPIEDMNFFHILKPKSFEIITMWHVLEHVATLKEFVSQLRNILTDNGTIIIAVPNCEAFEQTIYKDYWAAYDVPRHLNHFSKNTLSKLMEINDLIVKDIKPMPFDSFYVSMLSEKYKGGGLFKMAVKGLINGLKSNRASSRDINKASSLIYIITKNPASLL